MQLPTQPIGRAARSPRGGNRALRRGRGRGAWRARHRASRAGRAALGRAPAGRGHARARARRCSPSRSPPRSAAGTAGSSAPPTCSPPTSPGTSVYGPATGEWDFRPGPIFANVVLVDEVNRASPRTQAALLEPMEERQVTVDGVTHRLPDPFFLVATQNPFGSAGTFPLPESQLDRFALVCSLGLPGRAAEREILDGTGGIDALDVLAPVTAPDGARGDDRRGPRRALRAHGARLRPRRRRRDAEPSRRSCSARRRARASGCCTPRRRTQPSWVATSCRPTT